MTRTSSPTLELCRLCGQWKELGPRWGHCLNGVCCPDCASGRSPRDTIGNPPPLPANPPAPAHQHQWALGEYYNYTTKVGWTAYWVCPCGSRKVTSNQ